MSFRGHVFCSSIDPLLANLKALLEMCALNGIDSSYPPVAQGQALYDEVNSNASYIPGTYYVGIGRNCDQDGAAVSSAISLLKTLLTNSGINYISGLPFPNAEPPSSFDGVPLWVKVAGFGVLGVAALHYLSPLFGPGQRRLAGHRRSRRSRR